MAIEFHVTGLTKSMTIRNAVAEMWKLAERVKVVCVQPATVLAAYFAFPIVALKNRLLPMFINHPRAGKFEFWGYTTLPCRVIGRIFLLVSLVAFMRTKTPFDGWMMLKLCLAPFALTNLFRPVGVLFARIVVSTTLMAAKPAFCFALMPELFAAIVALPITPASILESRNIRRINSKPIVKAALGTKELFCITANELRLNNLKFFVAEGTHNRYRATRPKYIILARFTTGLRAETAFAFFDLIWKCFKLFATGLAKFCNPRSFALSRLLKLASAFRGAIFINAGWWCIFSKHSLTMLTDEVSNNHNKIPPTRDTRLNIDRWGSPTVGSRIFRAVDQTVPSPI